MKKYIPHAIAAAAVILLALAGYRACNLTDDYSELKGQYKTYVSLAEAQARARNERVNALSAMASAQNRVIEERDATIAAKQGQVVSGNKKLADLEAEFATLGQDKDAKIVNLQAQVATLKANITLAYSIISDKDAIIGAWGAKFDAQVKITDEWVRAYNDEHKLRLMSESLVSSCEKRLKASRFASGAKNIVIVAAGGWLAYNAIRGK
jgi:hypothetical protein